MTDSCPEGMMQWRRCPSSWSCVPGGRSIPGVPEPSSLGRTTVPNQALPRSGWEIRAHLVCILCARTVGSARGPDARLVTLTSVRLLDARHAEAVRRLRCPYCSGRLWLQNSEEIHVDRRPLTTEELRPRHGRPPKIRGVS
jgi:hypothetical protein